MDRYNQDSTAINQLSESDRYLTLEAARKHSFLDDLTFTVITGFYRERNILGSIVGIRGINDGI